MLLQRRRWFGTPMSWYTLIGASLLALSIWVPFLTANRSARVEERADRMASLLLEALQPMAAVDTPSPDVLFGRFQRLAHRDGIFVNDLERLDQPLPGTMLTLVNKHYAFHVAASPPEDAIARGRDSVSAYECVAWPLSNVGPGHGVFFHPDDAPRAYTRNLTAGYHGLGKRRPLPGRCHRREGEAVDTHGYYRSAGDERWILY